MVPPLRPSNSPLFPPTLKQWAEAVLLSTCARPTRAFQVLMSFLEGVAEAALPARIERAHSYRARSASRKGTWPLPPHSSETVRCSFPFHPLNGGVACQLSSCARRSRSFLGRAIREHRERQAITPSPPNHDDESATTHPRSARKDSWLTPAPVAVRRIDGW